MRKLTSISFLRSLGKFDAAVAEAYVLDCRPIRGHCEVGRASRAEALSHRVREAIVKQLDPKKRCEALVESMSRSLRLGGEIGLWKEMQVAEESPSDAIDTADRTDHQGSSLSNCLSPPDLSIQASLDSFLTPSSLSISIATSSRPLISSAPGKPTVQLVPS
jgi:hypothetical protein